MANSPPKQLSNQKISAEHITPTISALHVIQIDSSGGFAAGGGGGAGSTQVSVKEILSSSGGSLIDSSNVSLGVTIRSGLAVTEYTEGDVDATISGRALLFDNSSNTLRSVNSTRGLPVNIVRGLPLRGTSTDTFSTAATGTTIDASSQGMARFSLQVTQPTGSTLTSWEVVLEGSNDSTTFATLLTHTRATDGNGGIVFSGANHFPVMQFRSRCSSFVQSTTTSTSKIVVSILGMP